MYKTIGRFLILLVIPAGLWAQSLGLESGVAGVENFQAQQGYSVSVFVPLNDRVLGNLSFHWWGGEDQNYRVDLNHPEYSSNAPYYGNSGLNLFLCYRLLRSGPFSLYFGSGLGRYKEIRLDKNNKREYLRQAAFSQTVLLTYNLNDRITVYTRGFISTERYIIESPSWGQLNLGIQYHITGK